MTNMKLSKEQTGFTDPSWTLNPMQELIVPHMDNPDINMLVIAETSAGKTTVGQMVAYKHLFADNPKKMIYVAPMKALVEEKRRDWSDPDHPYSILNVEIVTGDHINNWENPDKLRNADIIVITPESLASRLRNRNQDKSMFLDNVGLLWIDEIHNLGEDIRGATLEACILEFSHMLPETQILATSATMLNHKDISAFMSRINKLETVTIISDYRPVPLTKHFIPFYETKTQDHELERIQLVKQIIEEHPDDQMMIGIFKKAFGRKMETSLVEDGYAAEFHNADVDFINRDAIDKKFKNGTLRYMLATQTQMVGVNNPVRRVIITAVANGQYDIKASMLNQCAGRAGRKGFDKEGDAYFFIPVDNFEYHKSRIEKGEPVFSQLNNKANVAIHFLGAIYTKRIKNQQDFFDWFNHTLAQIQFKFTPDAMKILLREIVDDMLKKSMIRVSETDETYELTKRGLIVVQMSIDPYHLYDLAINFGKYFSYTSVNKYDLAVALGSCTPYERQPGKEEIWRIPQEIQIKATYKPHWVASTAYFHLLNNSSLDQIPDFAKSHMWNFKSDIERVVICLDRLNHESERWDEDYAICALCYQVLYGVSKEEGFLMYQGLSRAKAKKIAQAKVTDLREFKKPGNAGLAEQYFTKEEMRKLKLK